MTTSTAGAQARPRDERERVARRLLAGSARHSCDPAVDVDWDTPLDPALPAAPLHRLSLYGTDLWERLTPEQRVRLSWQEVASVASTGLWFEVILMQMLVRYAYDRDPRTADFRYALTEVGDECRHSVMFARMADLLGDRAYHVGPGWHRLGRLFKATGAGPGMFAAVLVAEETLDRLQREIVADESLLPLSRQVARVHVTEEARHVSYARAAVTRQVPRLRRSRLELHRATAAVVSWAVVANFIDPRVYLSVGIDPQVGRAAARANPHWRETRRWSAEKVTAFLTEAGIVGGPSRRLWRRAGLVG